MNVALVVDDEVFARLIVAQVLLDEGYHVLEAGDAAEALEVLDCNPDISLLISDINMPGNMDGIALAKEVRRQKADVAIVLVSGFAPPPDDRVPPSTMFLAKPFTASQLLGKARATDQVRSKSPARVS